MRVGVSAVRAGTREFSKDSPLDLDLVTAATNIRAYTFGIPLQSRFDVKSIAGARLQRRADECGPLMRNFAPTRCFAGMMPPLAGNIIPAIATTNAVVAGLEVLEAIKIVQGKDLAEHGAWRPAGVAYKQWRAGGLVEGGASPSNVHGRFAGRLTYVSRMPASGSLLLAPSKPDTRRAE